MSKEKARRAAREAIHSHYCGPTRECPKDGCEGDLSEVDFTLIFDAIMGVYFPTRQSVDMSSPTVQVHNLAVSRGAFVRPPGF